MKTINVPATTLKDPVAPQSHRSKQIALSLLGVAIVCIGMFPILTGQWAGHSKQGKLVILDGAEARAMGAFFAFMGTALLAVWMPGRWSVVAWVSTCFGAAGVCLALLLYWK